MTVKKDEEGFTIVTIGDLKEYLSRYPDDMTVDLDKDGWMCTEIPHNSAVELIAKRGLFHRWDGENHLTINN